jgi:hypothetical protein
MLLIRAGLLAVAFAGAAGCNPLGATCVSRQKTGAVDSTSGVVGPGETRVHRLTYGTEGSQNDINVSWPGQGGTGAPHIQFYVTRVGCEQFTPSDATGACAVLARGGWIDGSTLSSLIVTNGRGNPDVLGTPAEYKLWVVGDAVQSVAYSVTTTFFYGPDC